VRPWALAAPVVVLLICLPLLRPLRQPDPTYISDDEAARLATIESIVERHTLDISRSEFTRHTRLINTNEPRVLADQPPALSLLLAVPYWVMSRGGLSLAQNSVLVPYLLTLVGATIPVAFAAGLLHRMGRLFELPRHLRAALALSVVTGSGMLSYAVVINSHAPAAAFVVAGVTCLVHVATVRQVLSRVVWLVASGACVGVGASIEPAAVVFVVLLVPVVLAIRWKTRYRVGGAMLFLFGAAPLLLLSEPFGKLTRLTDAPQTQARWFSTFSPQEPRQITLGSPARPGEDEFEDATFLDIVWRQTTRDLTRFMTALFGRHGLLSHFPVLGLGMLGIAAVMHRNWPAFTKVLALASGGGALVVVLMYVSSDADWRGAMFANRWLVVASPLLLFCAGAWLRRQHPAGLWVLAGVSLVFSTTVALIGALGPMPRDGFDTYTVVDTALRVVDDAPDSTSLDAHPIHPRPRGVSSQDNLISAGFP